jgi:hypothetical protein
VTIAGAGGGTGAALATMGRLAGAVPQPGQPTLAALADAGSNAAAASKTITSDARRRSR